MLCWKSNKVIIIDLFSTSAHLCKLSNWYSGHINYLLYYILVNLVLLSTAATQLVLVLGVARITSHSFMPLPDWCTPMLYVTGCLGAYQ